MQRQQSDPLVRRIEADWEAVAHGGTLNALKRDLQELERRDNVPGTARDKYARDMAVINADLERRHLLPSMDLVGVKDNKVLVRDNARHDKLMALQPGAGMTQVVDVEREAAGRVILKKQDPKADILRGPITPDGVRQGDRVPDCRLQARMASLAVADPGAIARMITDNHNGTYTVTFPGDRAHPQTVTAPTDWEKSTFSNGQGSGNQWALVIEKAYRQRTHQPFGPVAPTTDIDGLLTGRQGSVVAPVPDRCWGLGGLIDGVGSWFGASPICLVPTSKESLSQQIARHGGKAFTAPDSDTGRYLAEAMDNHVLVNTFVAQNKWRQAAEADRYATDSHGSRVRVVPGHAFTVTAYDARRELVTLRNPWGKNINPETRQFTGTGYLTMGLDQFKRLMSGLILELSGRSR